MQREDPCVGHLYPDYLNIYADRGNIAVLARRAAWRGHELEVVGLSVGDRIDPDAHDLLYVGGGQDREQALVARELAGEARPGARGRRGRGAVLAVCGGYQLLGRFYRFGNGEELPGVGLFPLHTIAGERRMIGDILLDCELEPGGRRTLAGFENHAGRTYLDRRGAAGPGRVGLRQRRDERFRGLPRRSRDRDVPPRPPPAAQPVAGRLAPRAGDRAPDRRGGAGARGAPDELEREAHAVAATAPARGRARRRHYRCAGT